MSDDNITKLPVQFRERPPEERSLVRRLEMPAGLGECLHTFVTYIVNDAEADVECGRCGTRLNPMWVLAQIAIHDRRHHEAQKAAKAMSARLEEKRRCKCEHCGKMTRIRRL